MSQKIARYKAGWHPGRDQGAINLKFEDGKETGWKTFGAAEFCAIMQVLNADDDVYVTDKGTIAMGPDEPGN